MLVTSEAFSTQSSHREEETEGSKERKLDESPEMQLSAALFLPFTSAPRGTGKPRSSTRSCLGSWSSAPCTKGVGSRLL